MKKALIIAAIAAIAFAIPASAEEYENPVGVGVDLIVWEEPDHKLAPQVKLELEQDINNREFGFMVKGELNVFKWLQAETS